MPKPPFFSLLAGALPVLLSLAVGCDGQPGIAATGGPVVQAPPGSISVYQLAGRLGMRVVESSETSATLCSGRNTVTLFADPGGAVYVNGQPAPSRGPVTSVSHMLFAQESLGASLAHLVPPREPEPRPVTRWSAPLGPVVIDAGHGGSDPGAISVLGTAEKDVNLAVAERVADLLSARGVEVIRTRRGDTFVELNERAAIANRRDPELFVSIHADSADNPAATGSTVYVCRAASLDSLAAARAVEQALGARGVQSRGIREADFRVLVRTSCPAILVELGFLSNPVEAGRLVEADYQAGLAAAISEAILRHLRS